MKSVALCIPAYNAAGYLPRLLASAQNQQYPFAEILVYDDHSQDNTAEVARNFGAKVITGAQNKGCSYGKNILAYSADSEWLHFHDADDDLLPNFGVEIQNWLSYDPPYEILLLNFNYIDFHSGKLLGKANHDINDLHRDPVSYAISHKIVNFGLYKKKDFLQAGGFDLDPEVLYNEDNALHQRLAIKGLRFDYLPEVTCINFRYRESMSAQNKIACARANYEVLKKSSENLNNSYAHELSVQLWNTITILASFQDWTYVRQALGLLKFLKPDFKVTGKGLFSQLTRIDLYFAVWFREQMIRLFKSKLRKGYD